MKKIYALLFIALFGLSLYSCKKDSPEKSTNKIVGEWRIDYRIFELYTGEKMMDTYTENYTNNNPEYVSLNEDGTGAFKEDGKTYLKFVYAISDNTINFTNVTELYKGKWDTRLDFKYTILKSNVNELYFAIEGAVASPSLYDKYITRAHLVK